MIELKILSTPDCVPCEVVERIAVKMQEEFPDLRVEKRALREHPEIAVSYGVMMPPTVVINRKVVCKGAVSEARLRATLKEVS